MTAKLDTSPSSALGRKRARRAYLKPSASDQIQQFKIQTVEMFRRFCFMRLRRVVLGRGLRAAGSLLLQKKRTKETEGSA
jgi:hypothetical protein